MLDENRGSTFFTGGDGGWDVCPSVFNFVREYNSGVRGGATGFTRVLEIPFTGPGRGERGLNLSVSGAVAADLPHMMLVSGQP